MATYIELFALRGEAELQNRVAVAVIKAAEEILSTSPTPAADRVNWAVSVLADPHATGIQMLNLILAANSGLTVSAIRSASDASIQTNVDSMVDSLVLAHAS